MTARCYLLAMRTSPGAAMARYIALDHPENVDRWKLRDNFFRYMDFPWMTERDKQSDDTAILASGRGIREWLNSRSEEQRQKPWLNVVPKDAWSSYKDFAQRYKDLYVTPEAQSMYDDWAWTDITDWWNDTIPQEQKVASIPESMRRFVGADANSQTGGVIPWSQVMDVELANAWATMAALRDPEQLLELPEDQSQGGMSAALSDMWRSFANYFAALNINPLAWAKYREMMQRSATIRKVNEILLKTSQGVSYPRPIPTKLPPPETRSGLDLTLVLRTRLYEGMSVDPTGTCGPFNRTVIDQNARFSYLFNESDVRSRGRDEISCLARMLWPLVQYIKQRDPREIAHEVMLDVLGYNTFSMTAAGVSRPEDIGKHYNDLKFRDFKHGITGAMLWKGQHPDVENYYGSVHQKAGADCADCHMPKVKDAKTGKIFTSHWQTSPSRYLKETCLTCHESWSEQQAQYAIDSLKNRVQGKLRKAEFWLTRMIDKFEEAKGVGVDEAILSQVREKHFEAHINWEWWTASNGAHFHNPDEAVESLNKSMTISQAAIKQLEDGMSARRGATR